MAVDTSHAVKRFMSPDTSFDLLTVREVADLMHVSKAHVSNVLAGRVRGCSPIPSVRLGRRTPIRRGTLSAWIEENDKNTGPSSVLVTATVYSHRIIGRDREAATRWEEFQRSHDQPKRDQ
jgi:hypothetical protein